MHQAQVALGTGQTYDMTRLFQEYFNSLWVMEQNNEWSGKKFMGLTINKFALLDPLVCSQIETEGRFTITTPFLNPCSKCGGAGQRWKFQRKAQIVKCMKCPTDGTSCTTCRDSKEVKVNGITGVILGTTLCTYCKGRGYFKHKPVDNPVLNIEQVKKIKASVVEKPSTSLGAEIKSAETDQTPPPPMIDPKQPGAE